MRCHKERRGRRGDGRDPRGERKREMTEERRAAPAPNHISHISRSTCTWHPLWRCGGSGCRPHRRRQVDLGVVGGMYLAVVIFCRHWRGTAGRGEQSGLHGWEIQVMCSACAFVPLKLPTPLRLLSLLLFLPDHHMRAAVIKGHMSDEGGPGEAEGAVLHEVLPTRALYRDWLKSMLRVW